MGWAPLPQGGMWCFLELDKMGDGHSVYAKDRYSLTEYFIGNNTMLQRVSVCDREKHVLT